MSYIWEKLYTAVHGLATSEGSLRERLAGGYIEFLNCLQYTCER